jgi:hypothetical protein
MGLSSWLSRFRALFESTSAAPLPNLSSTLLETEELSRFLFDRRRFKAPTETAAAIIHRKAFEPAKDRTTSVFRVFALSEAGIWDLGEREVGRVLDQRVLARADITVSNVRRHKKLRVDADDDPPRHAAILGWPENKEEQMSLCQELAADAVLTVRPTEVSPGLTLQ